MYAKQKYSDSRRGRIKKLVKCPSEVRRENPVSRDVMSRRKARVSKKSQSSQVNSKPIIRSNQRSDVSDHQSGTDKTRRNVEFTKENSRSPSPEKSEKSARKQLPASQTTNSSWEPSSGPSTSAYDEIETIPRQGYGKIRGSGELTLLQGGRDDVITSTDEIISPGVHSVSFSDLSNQLSSVQSAKKTTQNHFTQENKPKNKTLHENLNSFITEDMLASSFSAKPKHITSRSRKIIKNVGSAGYFAKSGRYRKRLIFEPDSDSVNSYQKEVISKWKKRLGTSSVLQSSYKSNFNSSILPSSSQILQIHNTDTSDKSSILKEPNLSNSTNSKLSEKDVSEVNQDETPLSQLRHRQPSDVLSRSEEKALFQDLERERKESQIRRLEETARTKLDQLEIIRWKKRKALEEELLLNEKLEKIILKMEALCRSQSFARLIDKQTQVFATKRPKTNLDV